MKKSIYSITLLDDVVRAVDRAAFESGTTRSGLINKILAEHLGLPTPETRQRDIFTSLAHLISGDESFLINSDIGDSLFAVKSSLRFKYNPTIRYSVAIHPEGGDYFGEIRAQLRTQNAQLIAQLDVFFAMWQKLEDAYFGVRLSEFGNGRFVRQLRAASGTSADALGKSAARYIRHLNNGISAHFRLYPDIDASAAYVSKLYAEYINMYRDIV